MRASATTRAAVAAAIAAPGCSTNLPAPQDFVVEATTGGARCADSTEAMSDCIDGTRYVQDLVFVAAERVPGDAHWQAVQDLCFERFTEYGYDVELHQYGTGVNVVGTKPGLTLPEQQIVIAAHYDHIRGCPGADDNATGVAGVLEIARVVAEASFERTAIVACWDQEEIGLLGSRSWVLRADQRREQIVANFNFEMIGYTDDAPDSQMVPAGFDLLFPEAVAQLAASHNAGNFVTVIADDSAAEPSAALIRHAARVGLPLIHLEIPGDLKTSALLSDLRRSDHASFWAFDYPAMMLTDTSNFRYAAYHCSQGKDTVDMLDHGFTTLVLRTNVAAITDTLGLMPSQ